MRINVIQSSNGVNLRKNGVRQLKTRNAIETPISQSQSQPQPQAQAVNFKGVKTYVILGILGAILGTAILGPVGLFIGVAAGLKGAQLAEEDAEFEERQKNKNNKK